MRMGKVRILDEYVVDLDNEEMVEHAKDALIEDVFNTIKFDSVQDGIEIIEDATLIEADIPEFLREDRQVQGAWNEEVPILNCVSTAKNALERRNCCFLSEEEEVPIVDWAGDVIDQ